MPTRYKVQRGTDTNQTETRPSSKPVGFFGGKSPSDLFLSWPGTATDQVTGSAREGIKGSGCGGGGSGHQMSQIGLSQGKRRQEHEQQHWASQAGQGARSARRLSLPPLPGTQIWIRSHSNYSESKAVFCGRGIDRRDLRAWLSLPSFHQPFAFSHTAPTPAFKGACPCAQSSLLLVGCPPLHTSSPRQGSKTRKERKETTPEKGRRRFQDAGARGC